MPIATGNEREELEAELEVSFTGWFDLASCLVDSRFEGFVDFADFFFVAFPGKKAVY